MGLFNKIFNSSSKSPKVVRCDVPEFLVWKYDEPVDEGSLVVVKDGEVAVLIGSTQTTLEGPANTTASEKLNAVYYINLAGSNVVRFAVPYFGVNDPRFPDLNVPIAVRGSVNFGVEDYKSFIRMHRLVSFDMESFQKKIKDAVVKYVKAVVSNVPTDYGIPLIQMEKKILEVGSILQQYLNQRMAADFAINVRGVDLNAIEYDADDDNYKELRSLTQDQVKETSQAQHKINLETMHVQSQLNLDAQREIHKQDIHHRGANLQMDREDRAIDMEDRKEKMRIQRTLANKATNAQIDEMQKSGRLAMGQPMGGMNFGGGINIGAPQQITQPNPIGQIGQPSGLNMGAPKAGNLGGTTPPPMGGAPQMPPQLPNISVYVAIGGQQQGPFDANMLKQMIQTNGLTPQTLVWKEGLTAWTPAQQVPEIASLFNAPQIPPVPPTMPPSL